MLSSHVLYPDIELVVVYYAQYALLSSADILVFVAVESFEAYSYYV